MQQDFFNDDEGEGFSFADIERQEASGTMKMLLDIDDKLYCDDVSENKPVTQINTDNEDGDGFNHYRRYEFDGYQAHSEGVDSDEINSWKEAMGPYLMVVGKSICIAHEQPDSDLMLQEIVPPQDNFDFITSSSTSINNNSFSNLESVEKDDDLKSSDNVNSLVIIGKQIELSHIPVDTTHTNEGVNDDVDVSEGILEEVIAIDLSGIYDDKKSDSLPLSPRSAIHDELVSLYFDKIWPDVVNELRPLIRKVVELSRSTGLEYPKEDTPNYVNNEEEQDIF